jgi:uncharacterized protein (TIGR02996 family)
VRDFLDDAELAASERLNDHYRRLGNRISGGSRWIDIVDAATFAIVRGKYAADRANIYYTNRSFWRVVTAHDGVDRASFEVIADDFARDRNHVYWTHEVVYGVSPAELGILGPDGRFARDRGNVYYFYSGIHRTMIDTKTGASLGRKPIVLDGADPNSFEDLGELYGRDDRRVYYHSTLMQGVEAARVRVIGDGFIATDRTVYFQGEPVDDADAPSFLRWDNGYARDRSRVFLAIADDYPRVITLEGADPASFEALADGYARDATRAYYLAYPCADAVATELRVLGEGFASTASRVYFEGQSIEGADPATFEVLPRSGYARDRSRVFRRHLRNVDPDQYELVVVEGADPAAFSPLWDRLAENPDDLELLKVYADELIERGDSRGELIAVQLATPKSLELAARELELTTQHSRRLEAVVPFGMRETTSWRHGFLESVIFDITGNQPFDLLSSLAVEPAARLLRRIVIVGSTFDGEGDLTPVIAELAQLAHAFPCLAEFAIEQGLDLGSPYFEGAITIGDVTPLYVGYPRLEVLELEGWKPGLDPIYLPELVRFAATHLAITDAGVLARARWPRLEELQIGFAPQRIDDPATALAPIFEADLGAALTSVSVAGPPLAMPHILGTLPGSRLASHAKRLGFIGALVDTELVTALVEQAPALERFEEVAISKRRLATADRARLERVFGKRLALR